MRTTLAAERGVTLFEVALMLTATMALVAALAPTLSATLADARTARATADMEVIRDAIASFQADGFTRFTNNGTQLPLGTLQFLYGDGDIPAAGSSASWRNTTADSVNDFLEEHLVANSFNGVFAYSTVLPPVWRGAYVNAAVDPDPWGNRYAVNVWYLGASTNDVVVFSAGADEAVDTSDTGNPLAAGGDDLIVLVEA